jgi:hypothetical protein
MRAIKVQCQDFIFQVRKEAFLSFLWLALQLFDRIGHCAVSGARALL